MSSVDVEDRSTFGEFFFFRRGFGFGACSDSDDDRLLILFSSTNTAVSSAEPSSVSPASPNDISLATAGPMVIALDLNSRLGSNPKPSDSYLVLSFFTTPSSSSVPTGSVNDSDISSLSSSSFLDFFLLKS